MAATTDIVFTPIDLKKKYIVQLPPNVTRDTAEHVAEIFTQWLKSGQPFLFLPGEYKLVMADQIVLAEEVEE